MPTTTNDIEITATTTTGDNINDQVFFQMCVARQNIKGRHLPQEVCTPGVSIAAMFASTSGSYSYHAATNENCFGGNRPA